MYMEVKEFGYFQGKLRQFAPNCINFPYLLVPEL